MQVQHLDPPGTLVPDGGQSADHGRGILPLLLSPLLQPLPLLPIHSDLPQPLAHLGVHPGRYFLLQRVSYFDGPGEHAGGQVQLIGDDLVLGHCVLARVPVLAGTGEVLAVGG